MAHTALLSRRGRQWNPANHLCLARRRRGAGSTFSQAKGDSRQGVPGRTRPAVRRFHRSRRANRARRCGHRRKYFPLVASRAGGCAAQSAGARGRRRRSGSRVQHTVGGNCVCHRGAIQIVRRTRQRYNADRGDSGGCDRHRTGRRLHLLWSTGNRFASAPDLPDGLGSLDRERTRGWDLQPHHVVERQATSGRRGPLADTAARGVCTVLRIGGRRFGVDYGKPHVMARVTAKRDPLSRIMPICPGCTDLPALPLLCCPI